MRSAYLVGVLLLLSACAASDAEGPVKVGWIGPLTGDAASIGQSSRAAVEVAVDEVNAAGGINGRPLEVVFEDGKCNGKDANTAANKLFNVDGVRHVIGGHCSPETLAVAPLAEGSGRLLLSPCSSNPSITQAGDYVFRAYPSDEFQGAFAAEYLYGQGRREVAVLSCLNDWCQGISEVFKRRFVELGGEIVGEESFEMSARDLRSQVAKLRSLDPDAVYFLGFTEASIIGIKQIKEVDWQVPLLGGDAWDDPQIASGVGAAGDGAQYVVPFSPLTDEFKAKLRAKTGSDEVLVCTPQAYDVVHILAGMLRASTSPSDTRDALYGMPAYDGVSGSISFDENGDLRGAEYIVKEYRDGQLVSAS